MGSNFRWSDFYPLPTGYTCKIIVIGASGLLLATWHHQSGSNLYHLFSTHPDCLEGKPTSFPDHSHRSDAIVTCIITTMYLNLIIGERACAHQATPQWTRFCYPSGWGKWGQWSSHGRFPSILYSGCYGLYCPLPTYQECYHSPFSHALHIETHLLCPRSIIKIIIRLLFHTIRLSNDSCWGIIFIISLYIPIVDNGNNK